MLRTIFILFCFDSFNFFDVPLSKILLPFPPSLLFWNWLLYSLADLSLHSRLNPWHSAAVCIDRENIVGCSRTNIETGAVLIFMQWWKKSKEFFLTTRCKRKYIFILIWVTRIWSWSFKQGNLLSVLFKMVRYRRLGHLTRLNVVLWWSLSYSDVFQWIYCTPQGRGCFLNYIWDHLLFCSDFTV